MAGVSAGNIRSGNEGSVPLTTRKRITHRHVVEPGARIRRERVRVLNRRTKPSQRDFVKPRVNGGRRVRTGAHVVADRHIQGAAVRRDVARLERRARVGTIHPYREQVDDRARGAVDLVGRDGDTRPAGPVELTQHHCVAATVLPVVVDKHV